MVAPAVTVRWTAAAHDHLWTDAQNWSPSLPGSGVVARFARNDCSVDLAAAAGVAPEVGQIEVWGGSVQFADGAIHWKAPPYDAHVFADVGLRVDNGGRLVVDASATLVGLNTLLLGDVSAATLDVRGTLGDAQVYAGHAGAVSITVEGAAARWNTTGIDQSFELGGGAAATLDILDGGHVADGGNWVSATANSTMTIGGTTAGATALVSGAGSELRFALLDVGGSYDGTLDIADGGLVLDRGANVGELGDGTVSVSGPRSAWNNLDGLTIHGTAPHGSVSVTDAGTLRFGEYGLQLQGTLGLDASARLFGSVIVMGGGSLSGLAAAGGAGSTVTVAQSIELSNNPAVSGSNIGNFFGSAAGVTLVLAGPIATETSAYDPLAVGGGHVVLANATNGDFAMSLYGGVLEFSGAGSSGDGTVSFLDSSGATLEIDQTGTLANAIAGFASNSAADAIDLSAIAYDGPPSLSWLPSAPHDPVLGISDGTHDVALHLGSGYRLADFATASDGHGGTLLSYHA